MPSTPKTVLKKQVLAYLIERLGLLGFSYNKIYQVLEKEVSHGNVLTVGFGFAMRLSETSIYLNPTMGFYSEPVGSLLTRLTNLTRSNNVGVLGKSLGYLSPENDYRTWDFSTLNSRTIKRNGDEIVLNIEKYGIPSLMKLCDQDTLFHMLESDQIGLPGVKYYMLPAILYLKGDYATCQQYLARYLEDIHPYKPIHIYGDYDQFSRKLLELVETAS